MVREEQSALNGFRNSDVLLYGALASNEADQDPIDLAFLAAAAEADLSLDTYSQKEFVPFDPKTRMTEAAIQILEPKKERRDTKPKHGRPRLFQPRL